MIDIYLITNNINNKKYVGKTQKGYQNRFNQHANSYKHGVRTLISHAFHKYGKDNFSVKLLLQIDDDTWEYWETYYINLYKSHHSEWGYNMSLGGTNNPMDDALVKYKHFVACHTPEFIALQRKKSLGRGHSEATKQKISQRNLANPEIYTRGILAHNISKRVKVGIVQNEVVVKDFTSAGEACEYCGRPRKEAGNLLRYCDKYNLNGTRAKYYGYQWTTL